MSDNILKVNSLTKKYGKFTAVNDVSFLIKKGNIYGLLGPNGSGKSTTLGMLLNVINETSGSYVWFEGKYKNHEALKKVGALIEHPNFYPYMSAEQNLKLVAKIKKVSEQRVDPVLKQVNLFERKKDKFENYSLGMKQRLAIASALLNEPEFLILDEPTNGLDPEGIHEIREIILQIAKEGTTILVASHLLDEIEKVCTHVIILKNGNMIYKGPLDHMNATHGYFEVNAMDQDTLIKTLKAHPEISEVSKEGNLVIAKLSNPVESSSFNKYLFDNNVLASHLVKRKPSLESTFLELTK